MNCSGSLQCILALFDRMLVILRAQSYHTAALHIGDNHDNWSHPRRKQERLIVVKKPFNNLTKPSNYH